MTEADKPDQIGAEAEPPALTVQLAEPEAEPSKVPAPPPSSRRGGFMGGVLGGLVAAGAGFGVAQYVPSGWPLADTTALQAQLAAQAEDIQVLRAQIPAQETGLKDRIAALEARQDPDLAPLDDRIAALEVRFAAIEALPSGEGAASAALQALQAEVQALKTAATPANVQAITAQAEAQLQEATATAASIKAEAEAIAKSAEARTALGRVQAALDNGAPFVAALASLPAAPAILTGAAESGLPTLAALQDGFPDAARAALEAALRANMGESWGDRVTSFLRTQTGARSLEPREGSDPDAILSRAEAALTLGDLTTAVTEIGALPTEAQAAMAAWRAMAEQRLAAVQAVADLAATIGE